MMRVISLIDMDCFYAQVEQRDNPTLWGQPVIVVQHSRQGVEGGILAVSYEARPFGVKRGMSVAEAKLKCPTLNVCHVPIGEYADKADIQKYRDASAEVFQVLNNFDSAIIVEKASVDEAFLDLSVYVDQKLESVEQDADFLARLPSSHVANGEDVDESKREDHLKDFLAECAVDTEQKRLLIAAMTVEEIRRQIREKTQFHCSAGVGNNKMMAKLVCARHKPRQQTVVPWRFVKEILKTTPIGDVRGFGGKMGNRIQEMLNIKMMGDILSVDHSWLIESFPDQHEWLRSVAEGFDDEPVRARAESSSIAVSKNFPGKSAICRSDEMHKWLSGLTKELAKRLATDQTQNKRTAENLVYSLLTEEGKPQKTIKITSYHPDILFEQIWKAVRVLNKSENESGWLPKVFNVSLSANRFSAGIPAQNRAITEWLAARNEAKIVGDVGGDDDVIFIEEQPTTSKKATEIIVLDDEEVVDQQNSEDWITVDGKRISRDAFRQLPPIIKKQYEHRMALESARLLKLSASNNKPKRKRGANLNAENQQKKQKSSLDTFFKKRS